MCVGMVCVKSDFASTKNLGPQWTVEHLLQVYKAWIDQMGKHPLHDPSEGGELVRCTTAGTETTSFFLNLRFKHHSLIQHPCLDIPGEAVDCYSPVTGKHPPVPSLKKVRNTCQSRCFTLRKQEGDIWKLSRRYLHLV